MKYVNAKKMIQIGMRRVDGGILDLLYPPRCPICDVVLEPGIRICQKCREKLTWVMEPSCKKCGKPISNERQEFCYDCQRKKHAFNQGKALWIYEKQVRESIYRFKYQNKREYGTAYAQELAKRYGNWIMNRKIQAIVPIPLHKKRRRKRGFNQTEILAKELGRCLELPVCTDLLVRVIDTAPQKMLNDAERKNNLKKAFKSTKSSVKLKCILIVDDIYTTGSTLDAAAETLKKAGVLEVYTCCVSIGRGC